MAAGKKPRKKLAGVVRPTMDRATPMPDLTNGELDTLVDEVRRQIEYVTQRLRDHMKGTDV